MEVVVSKGSNDAQLLPASLMSLVCAPGPSDVALYLPKETFAFNNQPCAGRGPPALFVTCTAERETTQAKSGKADPELSVDWGAWIQQGRGWVFWM